MKLKIDGSTVYDSFDGQERMLFHIPISRMEKIDVSDIIFFLRHNIRQMDVYEDDNKEGFIVPFATSIAVLEQLLFTLPETTFACAPVRSNPNRVYTPSDQVRAPDGNHTQQTLFKIKESDAARWRKLKAGLEIFGEQSGLFSRINVARYKTSGSSPFQINVTRKGKQSNIVDVGYGVSQALPILTDLIENPNKSGFLFQQPEVHLHPQAQAALGSFFVDYLDKSRGSTIIAETHSDYLIDRVRLNVISKKIKASDVTILYFETVGSKTKILQIQIDSHGNILNAPPGYRDFFVKEQMDLLGISD